MSRPRVQEEETASFFQALEAKRQAVAGALLRVGATLAADRVRWSRARVDAMFEARRRLYADYLGDLATTRNAIRLVARGFHAEGVPRLQPASEAFTGVNPYSRRYQISIVSAPETVVIAATNTFRKLRELRDVVAAGHDPTSDAYAEGRVGYEDSLQGLVRVMRQDLAPVTSLR